MFSAPCSLCGPFPFALDLAPNQTTSKRPLSALLPCIASMILSNDRLALFCVGANCRSAFGEGNDTTNDAALSLVMLKRTRIESPGHSDGKSYAAFAAYSFLRAFACSIPDLNRCSSLPPSEDLASLGLTPVRTVKHKPLPTSSAPLQLSPYRHNNAAAPTSSAVVDPLDCLTGLSPIKAPRPPTTPAISRLSLQVASSQGGTLHAALMDVTSPAAAEVASQLHVDHEEDAELAVGGEPETPRLVGWLVPSKLS